MSEDRLNPDNLLKAALITLDRVWAEAPSPALVNKELIEDIREYLNGHSS